MSLKYEQYRSLLHTRDFLRSLLTVEEYPETKKEMRRKASACLRHYPFLRHDGEPMFSQDNFKAI